MDIKESLFDNLEELFGERLELIERTTEYGNLSDIPSALHSFYKKYSFAKMPFGSIFTVGETRKMSYQQPFMDEEWFCFGQDNYGFVEKIKWESAYSGYDDIISDLLKKSNNNYGIVNNNLIGDPLIMNNKELKKTFNELYDANNNTTIKLSKKIDFVITTDEDGFYYANNIYNVYVFGETQNEVENHLYEELKFQYDSYATEDDDSLDSNAIKLKYNLLSLFDRNA